MADPYNSLSVAYSDDEEKLMEVPDTDEGVTFEEEAPDIENIMQIRDKAGVEALTAEELELLEMFEYKQHAGKGHYTNLAEVMEEHELLMIARDVTNWVDWDENSRADWYEKEKKGIRALGVSPNVNSGAKFAGSSKATHPMLGEACVQFSSRALEQLWPAGGPVKSAVLGDANEKLLAQGKRVEQYMNYQYTIRMEGAFEQTDKMLLRLPLSGSVFIKTYYDPLKGVCREMVEPADFIVPYRATSLRTAPRYTERILRSQNNVKKLQVQGFYRNIPLQRPFEEGDNSEREVVKGEIERTEGREEQSEDTEDQRHTLYECYCELDLKGFEDKDEHGNPTGVALPYIVTVDRDTNTVLSIYRNWNPRDVKKKRIVYHTHYRYTPGLGFYGYGLYHWIGSLSLAASGALRALLDSAQFANMPGGFRAKDSALPSGQVNIAPGEWKEIDTDYDDLKKAFFPLPYKEPSPTLYNLMGTLDELGRRFAGTTEAMVGEGAQNTPVGTMLARIEQGSKVYTAIQKRLHESAKEEFKTIAYLNSLWLPDKYPYAVHGENRIVGRADFDSRIDVIPVSDPNYISNTQKYFVAQIMLEMAEKAPHLYDMREVHHRALSALKVDEIEKLLPDAKSLINRCDPVTENALVMIGKPIKAFMEQDHQAHIITHQTSLQGMEKDDPAAPTLQAHIREHMAMAYMLQMGQAIGVSLTMPDEENKQPLPPEIENRIAGAAAQAAQQMAPEPPPDPEVLAVQREQDRKDEIARREQDRKDREAEREMARKDMLAMEEDDRKDMVAAAEQKRKDKISDIEPPNWNPM